MKTKYIIFDLDDTLMYEVDYLKSAYKEIVSIVDNEIQEKLYEEMFSKYKEGENVFEFLNTQYSKFEVKDLLEIYRNHYPKIHLNENAKELLLNLKNQGYKIGLITDGRSVTQRNKLNALGVETIFDKIIVSEEFGSTKPDQRNYCAFIEEGIDDYYYIADNPKKDFVTPNTLGWISICLLNNGQNIHPQNFELEDEYLPKYRIKNLNEISKLI
ncbi:HAD family hydrolase [Chryseobacterium polytrichastri]|uniref:Putative hydrolase of the HAD superfamily n=1 Tax=Chryseobacterium polytrichastri TaxID=1302687 RepID=A0A1M6U394_9FLAO|nr:HAD family hydrolase [Chryseobacterium polytrichastri]SHK63656.1 putative hydrolase of the HAD superfamily [Chryseobacterium polytrichastri]